MGGTGMRGFSLIELLVGSAIGLVVVAAASNLVAHNLRENRAVILEARLMQDLRNAADIVGRGLRRAGYWAGAASGVRGDDGEPVAANPYDALVVDDAASGTVGFRFSRDAVENGVVDGNEQFGYRLRNGAIETQLGAANWQALTDPATLIVTLLRVVPRIEEASLVAFCPAPCPLASATCPPRQQIRSLAVAIVARSPSDPALTRDLRLSVRLRNDAVVGSCEV